MEAVSWPLSQIINIDQGAREHYHVPKYQRDIPFKICNKEESFSS
jgi:hypothetical protein